MLTEVEIQTSDSYRANEENPKSGEETLNKEVPQLRSGQLTIVQYKKEDATMQKMVGSEQKPRG